MDKLRGETALFLAWLLALGASLAVLFIGEVLGQMPCTLCWYQRIAMFPLVPILGPFERVFDTALGPLGRVLKHLVRRTPTPIFSASARKAMPSPMP